MDFLQILTSFLAGVILIFGIYFQGSLTRRYLTGAEPTVTLIFRLPVVIGMVLTLGMVAFALFHHLEDPRNTMRMVDDANQTSNLFYCGTNYIGSTESPSVLSALQIYSNDNCKLPFWFLVRDNLRLVFVVTGLFVLKSLIAPLANAVILSYTLYNLMEKGEFLILPWIETGLDFALGGSSFAVQASYTAVFMLYSFVTVPVCLWQQPVN